jgi:hypothetical protein
MTDADKVKRYEALLARVANIPTIRGRVASMTDNSLQSIVNNQCSIIDAVQAELIANGPPLELLKLFYVYYNEDSGDYTMFLRATSPEAAYGFWREWAEKDGYEINPDETVYVRTVPPAVGQYGRVSWGDIIVTPMPTLRGD